MDSLVTDKKNVFIPHFDVRYVHCPFCGNEKLRAFHTLSYKHVEIQYDICLYCGLVFQNPTFSENKWNWFYKNAYRAFYANEQFTKEKILKTQQQRAAYYSAWIKKYIHTIQYHLDIGTSAGYFAESIKNNFKTQLSAGIEPDAEYAGIARQKNILVYSTLPEIEIKLPLQKFDFISLCHVLEHISNPVPFLQYIRNKFISAHGFLFIEIPNIRFSTGYEFAHPFCYSLKTLQNVLQHAGFHIARANYHNNPKADNGRYKNYISVLARAATENEHTIKKAGYFFISTSYLLLKRGAQPSWFKFIAKQIVKR